MADGVKPASGAMADAVMAACGAMADCRSRSLFARSYAEGCSDDFVDDFLTGFMDDLVFADALELTDPPGSTMTGIGPVSLAPDCTRGFEDELADPYPL